ncbi:hypothetical protein ACTS95_14870 [Empedobacter brevis]
MNVQEIKSQLRHGAIKRIAKETNTHYMTVVNVMNGKKSNSTKRPIILSKALEVLEEQKRIDAQLSARFNEVVNYGTD